jgi:hypothetical protein
MREKTAKRVYIDVEECTGSGSSEQICEEVFRLNEETDRAEVIPSLSYLFHHHLETVDSSMSMTLAG